PENSERQTRSKRKKPRKGTQRFRFYFSSLIPREDQGRGGGGGYNGNILEAGLRQPGLIVFFPVSGAPFGMENHHGIKGHAEGMTGPVIVEDKIADQKGSSRLEGLSEFSKDLQITFGGFLMCDVGINRKIVFGIAEIGRVKISVDRLKSIDHP